jgi:hypothetical protein
MVRLKRFCGNGAQQIPHVTVHLLVADLYHRRWQKAGRQQQIRKWRD